MTPPVLRCVRPADAPAHARAPAVVVVVVGDLAPVVVVPVSTAGGGGLGQWTYGPSYYTFHGTNVKL